MPVYLFFKKQDQYLFLILFFGCFGSLLLRVGFLQCKQGLLFVVLCRLLIVVAFLRCGAWAQAHGLQQLQLWLAGSRAQAQQLWRTGLVAPQLVGSSRTRARTCVPCIGRWILNCCATREVPVYLFKRFLTGYSIVSITGI